MSSAKKEANQEIRIISQGKAKIAFRELKVPQPVQESDTKKQIKQKKPNDQQQNVQMNQQQQQETKVQSVVFYNPVQQFNRDISILTLREYIKLRQAQFNNSKKKLVPVFPGISVLEALSATGLRSVRYLLQVPGIKRLVANDILPQAAQLIKSNLQSNKIAQDIDYSVNLGDAIEYMYKSAFSKEQNFDNIDLDPYGSAQPFINSALTAISSSNGGLMSVTYTDSAVLCGKYTDTCYYKYGTVSCTKTYCHQMSLRIALYSISSQATQQNKYIKPLLSISTDFYIRLFLRVYDGRNECKQQGANYSYWAQCVNCQNYHVMPRLVPQKHHTNSKKQKLIPNDLTMSDKCEICQSRMVLYGPIWGADIHDREFVVKMLQSSKSEKELKTVKKIRGILENIMKQYDQELNQKVFGFDLPLGCKQIGTIHPPKQILFSSFQDRGKKIVQSYMKPSLYKSDANARQFYDILKLWKIKSIQQREKIKPIEQKQESKESTGNSIMIDELLKRQNISNERFLKNVDQNSYRFTILNLPIQQAEILQFLEFRVNANFDVNEEVKKRMKKEKKIPKFIPNPQSNWGPQSRAVGKQQNKSSSLEPPIDKKKKS